MEKKSKYLLSLDNILSKDINKVRQDINKVRQDICSHNILFIMSSVHQYKKFIKMSECLLNNFTVFIFIRCGRSK